MIKIKNFNKYYNRRSANEIHVINNTTLELPNTGLVCILGESGSGKTTIGRAIVRINPLSKGEIRFKGKRISGKLSKAEDRDVIKNIQMIFQDPAASLNERATVDYIISEGLYNFRLYSSEEERVAKVKKALSEVGLLEEHMTRYPHEFSGGQRQRIGIARSLIMEPEFIVADEPISALDVSIRAQVLNLLKTQQKEKGLTYLFIAHDLSVVRYISDRIAVIHKGKIVELANSEELFLHPLHPYTKSLMSAIPIPDPILEKSKDLITYQRDVSEYEREDVEFVEIIPGHFVLGNPEQIKEYRKEL